MRKVFSAGQDATALRQAGCLPLPDVAAGVSPPGLDARIVLRLTEISSSLRMRKVFSAGQDATALRQAGCLPLPDVASGVPPDVEGARPRRPDWMLELF